MDNIYVSIFLPSPIFTAWTLRRPKSEGANMSVITFDGGKEKYLSLDYIRARKLMELQQVLACPSNNDCTNTIKTM